ncbi:uncharacterized protein Triagg1_593 [Trichoderma aggressivum f. europaeum]|uniref:Peptidase C14 caspase domain-containing protein n=1 Tax=Trichoderma aggressivum f. europaeum TaxID=173218 RepID=A0AAE1INR8_9HYPO|nr:hypothetical protein Triagg1_593 [Trichoderma aggressivum f. europaeum]
MAPITRASYALLIACPNGLVGTALDIARMKKALEETGLGFEFHECHEGDVATRERILAEFESVIEWAKGKHQANIEPIVVLYYSGHGSMVESDRTLGLDGRRYQFIVPSGYNDDEENFNGILDHEIAYFLKKLTAETKNVTFIMDCCHSGRMARKPDVPGLKVRMTPAVQHKKLADHMRDLIKKGTVEEDVPLKGNQDVVRIVAAYPTEVAFEVKDIYGNVGGVMTRLLTQTLHEAKGRGLSWRTVMSRVRELTASEIIIQHPAAEGPSTRILFSKDESDSKSHVIKIIGGQPVIEAGRVAGARECNVYDIMPAGFEQVDDEHSLGEVEIVSVAAFHSIGKFTKKTNGGQIDPAGGALAFLKREATYQWVAEYPGNNEHLKDHFQRSKFLRSSPVAEQSANSSGTNGEFSFVECDTKFSLAHQQLTVANEKIAATHHQLVLAYAKFQSVDYQQAFTAYSNTLVTHTLMVDDYKQALDAYLQELADHKLALSILPQSSTATSQEKVLVKIKEVDGRLVVYNNDMVECFSMSFKDETPEKVSALAFQRAEIIARSQHLLALPSGIGKEAFNQELNVEFGLVEGSTLHPHATDGTATITEGNRVYIRLINESSEKVFVSGFSIDAAGNVSSLMAETDGIEIKKKDRYTFGYQEGESQVRGMLLDWADSVPKSSSVVETFVLFVTSDPVDLGHFLTAGSSARDIEESDSELVRLVAAFSTGLGRGVSREKQRRIIKYSVIRIPYKFCSSTYTQ